jgi:phosphatidylethanolamine-binding protein (PEBP) family uncharacterized protein
VHCLALIDPSGLAVPGELPPGALSAVEPGAGVRVLRSTMGRGYRGPEPIKGHGPHHYVFQLYAFAQDAVGDGQAQLDRVKPRAVLAMVTAPVVARGRLTGTYER